MLDGKAFAELLFDQVKSYTGRLVAPLRDGLAALTDRIKAAEDRLAVLPAPVEPVDVDALRADIERMVDERVAAQVAVALTDQAKSAPAAITQDDVRQMVDVAVASAVEALPTPENGKDADIGAIAELVSGSVRSIAESMPRPEPAKVDIEVVRMAARDAVAAAIADLPKPAEIGVDVLRDDIGKAVTEAVRGIAPPELPDYSDLIHRTVADAVGDAVAALPPAIPGKDADDAAITAAVLEQLRASVAEQIRAAADAIPRPEDGKDADPEEVRALVVRQVADAMAQMPVPKDGRSIEPDEVRAMVAEAVAALPPPAEVDMVAVRDEIEQSVRRHVEAIELPRPEAGKPGESAFEVAVRNGFAGTETEWLASLRGKDGIDGLNGTLGEPIAMIDPDRQYERGTIARHAGGLVRAYRNTDTFAGDLDRAGWDVIQAGVADLGFDLADDGRTVTVRSQLTGGKVNETVLKVPAQINRGIYSPDRQYERGDMVTFGGSQWHCDEPTADRPGEIGSKGWTLVVKRGRDGKSGDPGKKGDPGSPGRPGRDLTQLGFDGRKS